jgi:5S rRNA maturation endonuclease (ribonuclease M5)
MNQGEKRLIYFIDFLRVFIRELNEESDRDTVLLVEGKKDVMAIKRVGYTGRVASIHNFMRLAKKGIKPAKKVILMTDMDREGRFLASRLFKTISRMGISVSIEERKRLLIASGGLISTIESLSKFAENVRDYSLHNLGVENEPEDIVDLEVEYV